MTDEWKKFSCTQDAEMYVARPGLRGVWDRLRYVASGALDRGMLAPCKVIISLSYKGDDAEVKLATVQLEHHRGVNLVVNEGLDFARDGTPLDGDLAPRYRADRWRR